MFLILVGFLLSCWIVAQGRAFEWLRARRTKRTGWRKVLIVIAHPDDETMFFAPTIISLFEEGVQLSLLCLTNGTKAIHSSFRKCGGNGHN